MVTGMFVYLFPNRFSFSFSFLATTLVPQGQPGWGSHCSWQTSNAKLRQYSHLAFFASGDLVLLTHTPPLWVCSLEPFKAGIPFNDVISNPE